jgi:hypothetical protein
LEVDENQSGGPQARRYTKTGSAAKPALFFPAATLRVKKEDGEHFLSTKTDGIDTDQTNRIDMKVLHNSSGPGPRPDVPSQFESL